MQVSVETISSIERRLTIIVPSEQVDESVQKKLIEASKRVRMDGFRPGKAPIKVVKLQYGDSIREEVLGDVINKTYVEAVKQEKIDVAGYPAVDLRVNEEGKDLQYTATLEVYPKIDIGDFKKISVEKPITELEDNDVEDMIKTLLEQSAQWEEKEAPAEKGDQVILNYQGKKDGEIFEGGSAENSTLELGSGNMIPGFEDALEGMSKGDSKVVPLTFPSDYHAEELKGQDVEFEMTINTVKSKTLPELNDEFFEKFNVTEGGEQAFREQLTSNMQSNIKHRTKDEIKQQVMEGLIENHEFEIPKALIGNEIQSLRQQSVQRFGGMGGDDMDFTKMLPDELFSEEASKRVKLGLIVASISAEKEMKVDEARVDTLIEEFSASSQDPEQAREHYQQDQMKSSLRSMVIEDMIVEMVLEQAQVSEKSKTYKELIPQQQ